MKKAMIEGNIWKQLLAFTLPLLLGNLFQQTYNLADSAIVGQTLGANALAAVGSSSSVQFMVLGFCQGCAAGFAIPVASAFGAGNEKKIRQYVFLGAVLTAVIALILTLATCLMNTEIIQLLKTPSEIAADAAQEITFYDLPIKNGFIITIKKRPKVITHERNMGLP